MAGTGHPYEIANPSTLADFCDDLRGLFGEFPEIRDRFARADFRRYITGPSFCRALKNPASPEIDETERRWIVPKILSGQDVRLFAPAHVADIGPDFQHIIDFLGHTRLFNNAMFVKCVRDDFRVLVDKARNWRFLRRRPSNEPPATNTVLTLERELHWVELQNAAAMEDEGDQQDHCVGGLVYWQQHGVYRYFSLRDGSGKSLVTAEISAGPKVYCRQIRSTGNSDVPFHLQAASAALFNDMHCEPDGSSYAAMSAGLIFAAGRWKPIAEDWVPTRIGGLKVLTGPNAEAALFSPVDESVLLAMITVNCGPSNEWWKDGRSNEGSIRLSKGRHLQETELLAARDFANEFGFNCTHELLRLVDGKYRFLYDLHRSHTTRGGTIYSKVLDADQYLVHQSADRARILGIVKGVILKLTNVPRINAQELARLLDVASELGVKEIEVAKDDRARFYSRFRPCLDKCGVWFDIRAEGKQETTTAPNLTWYVARGLRVLLGKDGSLRLTMAISGQSAHVTSPGGLASLDVARCLIDDANARDLTIITCETVLPTLAGVHRLQRRWECIPTPAKLQEHLGLLSGGALDLTPDEHRSLDVLTWQQPWNPAFEAIILTNVTHWLENATDKVLATTPKAAFAGRYTNDMRLLHTVAGRLIWLCDRRERLSPTQDLFLRRTLALTFKQLCSSSPSKTSSLDALALAQIVTRYPDCFTQSQLYSAALRSLHRVRNFIDTKKPDELTPFHADWLRWYEAILPGQKSGRLRTFLLDQAAAGPIVWLDFETFDDVAAIERVLRHYCDCRRRTPGIHLENFVRPLASRLDRSEQWQGIAALLEEFQGTTENGCKSPPSGCRSDSWLTLS